MSTEPIAPTMLPESATQVVAPVAPVTEAPVSRRVFNRPAPAQIELEPSDAITHPAPVAPVAKAKRVPKAAKHTPKAVKAKAKITKPKAKPKVTVKAKAKIKRGGRTPKPEGEAFINVVPVRLNNADFDRLYAVAKRQATPLAACARGVMQIGLKSFRRAPRTK